jgi:predicted aspartyl protease
VLIDTGAEGNYISERSSKQFESIGILKFYETLVSIAESREKESKIAFLFKEVKILNAALSGPEFIILDGIDYEAIIGVEVLQMMGFSIDMRADRLK